MEIHTSAKLKVPLQTCSKVSENTLQGLMFYLTGFFSILKRFQNAVKGLEKSMMYRPLAPPTTAITALLPSRRPASIEMSRTKMQKMHFWLFSAAPS